MESGEWREGLFEAFDELVQIEYCGVKVRVPERNKLLRCFQYVEMDAISVGDYCWNGDCTNCLVQYVGADGEVRGAMACRMYVTEGLVITDLSEELRRDLKCGRVQGLGR